MQCIATQLGFLILRGKNPTYSEATDPKDNIENNIIYIYIYIGEKVN